jgi:hypothetical protein
MRPDHWCPGPAHINIGLQWDLPNATQVKLDEMTFIIVFEMIAIACR